VLPAPRGVRLAAARRRPGGGRAAEGRRRGAAGPLGHVQLAGRAPAAHPSCPLHACSAPGPAGPRLRAGRPRAATPRGCARRPAGQRARAAAGAAPRALHSAARICAHAPRARCGRSRTRTRWARWRCRGRRPRRPARSCPPRGPGSPSGALRPPAATTPSRCALSEPLPAARTHCGWRAIPVRCVGVCAAGRSKLAGAVVGSGARGRAPGAALAQRAAQRSRTRGAAPSRPPLPPPAREHWVVCLFRTERRCRDVCIWICIPGPGFCSGTARGARAAPGGRRCAARPAVALPRAGVFPHPRPRPAPHSSARRHSPAARPLLTRRRLQWPGHPAHPYCATRTTSQPMA